MKRIHIIGAGSPAGIGMTRCLQKEPDYWIQGHDQSKWADHIKECHSENEEGSEAMLHCDMVIPVPDAAVYHHREQEQPSPFFLPPKEQIELCQNKAKLADVLGELAPKSWWVRDIKGAGGQGAQQLNEYLPGRNVSVELVFIEGDPIGDFMKERISYSLKEQTQGIDNKGSSLVSVCIRDGKIMDTVVDALVKLPGQLNGFYGVDLKQAEDGSFKVTEINAGRLLTASYVYFYMTDYNLALAGVKAFFGEPYQIGQYPEGYGIIRTMDKMPMLVPPEIIKV